MKINNFYDLVLKPEVIHGGVGECMHSTVFSESEFDTPVRFMNYTVLPPKTTFGMHKHGDDNEVYIVLSGEGIYTQDGEAAEVRKGSVMINGVNSSHGIENTGDCNMELLVLEVYNKHKI